MAGEFVEKARGLGRRARRVELALQWENVVVQPRQQFPLATAAGRVLREMRVDIDESGTNHRAGGQIDPVDRVHALAPVQGIVIAYLNDHTRGGIDDHRPVAPCPEFPKRRRVEELAAQTEQNFGGG